MRAVRYTDWGRMNVFSLGITFSYYIEYFKNVWYSNLHLFFSILDFYLLYQVGDWYHFHFVTNKRKFMWKQLLKFKIGHSKNWPTCFAVLISMNCMWTNVAKTYTPVDLCHSFKQIEIKIHSKLKCYERKLFSMRYKIRNWESKWNLTSLTLI